MSNVYMHQAMLEALFNKTQLMPRLRQEVHNEGSIIELLRNNDIPVPLGVNIIVQLMLRLLGLILVDPVGVEANPVASAAFSDRPLKRPACLLGLPPDAGNGVRLS